MTIGDILHWFVSQFGYTTVKAYPPDVFPDGASSVEGAKVVIDTSINNVGWAAPPIPHLSDIPATHSMDGLFDYGNQNLYLQPASPADQKVMVAWAIKQFEDSKGLKAADMVYRHMQNPGDDPWDFSKPALLYAIHRLYGVNANGTLVFKGVNNPRPDQWAVLPGEVMMLMGATIY